METVLWAFFYLFAFSTVFGWLMIATAAYFVCIRGGRYDPFRRRPRRAPS